MNGIDALVFTDRIGEGSPALRAAACEGLQCLGVRLDAAKNQANPLDSDIAAADSAVRVLVVRTREDLMIAGEARRVMLAWQNPMRGPDGRPIPCCAAGGG